MTVQITGTRIEFRVLGPLEVAFDHEAVALVGGRQRALLAYLLLHPNEPLASDRLIEELWGASSTPTAMASLRVAVSKLRRVLGEEHGRALETVPGGYRLRLGRDELDAGRFEALLTEARAEAEPARIVGLLEEALALWRGSPLADVAYEPFAQNEIRRLTELRLTACEERIEAELALGQHDRVVAELARLVDEHPLRERLRGQLMLALYRSGRQADALEVYRRGRRELLDELGLEPGNDLRRLEQEILTHDPSIGAPPRAAHTGFPRHQSARRRIALIAASLVAVGALAAVVITVLETRNGVPQPVATLGIAAVDPRTGAIADSLIAAPIARLAVGRRSLWATDARDQTVVELDLQTERVARTIGIGVDPDAIAVGEGAVWVLSGKRLLRIDPAFTFVRTIKLPFRAATAISVGAPQSIAAGAGAVWVENGSALYRIEPATDKVTGQRRLGPEITSVAVGAGSVWVSRGSPPSLLRVDPQTLSLTATIPIAAHVGTLAPYPIGVAVGAGAVWVLNGNTGTVTRIDPTLDNVAATVSRISLNPTRMAFGEGSLWVVDDDGNAILRIDPTTNQVAQSIPVNGFPTSVAAGHGEIWVGTDAS